MNYISCLVVLFLIPCSVFAAENFNSKASVNVFTDFPEFPGPSAPQTESPPGKSAGKSPFSASLTPSAIAFTEDMYLDNGAGLSFKLSYAVTETLSLYGSVSFYQTRTKPFEQASSDPVETPSGQDSFLDGDGLDLPGSNPTGTETGGASGIDGSGTDGLTDGGGLVTLGDSAGSGSDGSIPSDVLTGGATGTGGTDGTGIGQIIDIPTDGFGGMTETPSGDLGDGSVSGLPEDISDVPIPVETPVFDDPPDNGLFLPPPPQFPEDDPPPPVFIPPVITPAPPIPTPSEPDAPPPIIPPPPDTPTEDHPTKTYTPAAVKRNKAHDMFIQVPERQIDVEVYNAMLGVKKDIIKSENVNFYVNLGGGYTRFFLDDEMYNEHSDCFTGEAGAGIVLFKGFISIEASRMAFYTDLWAEDREWRDTYRTNFVIDVFRLFR